MAEAKKDEVKVPDTQKPVDSPAVKVQSVEDLTQKGPAVSAQKEEARPPKVENMVVSTPEHDVPVATTYVGPGGEHTPPDPEQFDEYGRPRTK